MSLCLGHVPVLPWCPNIAGRNRCILCWTQNRWRCMKVEMIPKDKQISHANMLIKLSNAKAYLVENLVLWFPSNTCWDDLEIFRKSVCIILPPLLGVKNMQRCIEWLFLWLPALLRASCVLRLQIRGGFQWRHWCCCHSSKLCATETLQKLNQTICSWQSDGTWRENPPPLLEVKAPKMPTEETRNSRTPSWDIDVNAYDDLTSMSSLTCTPETKQLRS